MFKFANSKYIIRFTVRVALARMGIMNIELAIMPQPILEALKSILVSIDKAY